MSHVSSSDDVPATALGDTLTALTEDGERWRAPSGASAEGSAGSAGGAEARFEPQRVLGEGGMGTVSEARDRLFGRLVAVKTLRAGCESAELERRFLVEAVVTANLEHPGVPAVYERGRGHDGLPFYAMRLVRGRTLKAALADATTLQERLRLLPIVLRTAQTLAFAHERGVVHRDVKPENIVVGKHGETVLLDWGIAKVRGTAMPSAGTGPVASSPAESTASTQHGAVMGTPQYMAPEQASGQVDRIDERTDVFALGTILYHLLAGHAPYRGANVSAVLAQACDANPPDIEQLAPAAPRALREIVRTAMSRAPENRYPSAALLADALESFVDRAVSGDESRAVKIFADTASVIALLLVTAAVVLMWQVVSSVREMGIAFYAVVAATLAGVVFSLIEWKTRGRYQLSPLSLVFAVWTVLTGLGSTVMGGELVLRVLMRDDVVGDPDKWRAILTEGSHEALGTLAVGCVLGSLQFVLWGIARRRTLLSRSAR